MPSSASGRSWLRIREWVASGPSGGAEAVHRAATFRVVLLGTVGVTVAVLSLLIVVEPHTLARRGGTIAFLLALGASLLEANRRGYTLAASWTLIAGLILVLTWRTFTSGGVHAPATPAYVVIVLMAGLLLGERGGIATAATSVVAVFAMALTEHFGVLPEAQLTYPPLISATYSCLWIGLAIPVQRMVASSLRGALDRAQSELEARRVTQNKLNLAVDAAEFGIFELDLATRRVRLDSRLLELGGLTPDADGMVSAEVWGARIAPEDRATAEKLVADVASGTPHAHAEFAVVRADGTRRYLEAFASPSPDGAASIGVSRDITARRSAQVERERLVGDLRERIKELGLLHAAARLLQRDRPFDRSLLVTLVDLIPPAWQYPDICEARIVYGELSAQTRGWRETPWQLSIRVPAIEGEVRIDVAYTAERPSADEGPFLAEERQLLDSLSEILIGYLDLRRHREGLEALVERRTQELRALEQLRDDLVKMVVHDMRSPLTALLMSLDLIKSKGGAELARPVESAVRTADSVNRMANNLLDVSRLEEGKMPVRRAPADLARLIAEVRDELQMLDRSRAIEIEAAEGVTANCDGGLVRRVIENLVSNAIKHTPSGMTVRVAVTAEPRAVRVAVTDEGEGIPADAREKIFEKFGTLEARRTHNYHSVGLGLAFCKLAVAAHGGRIGVEAAPSGGSAFWFELPR